jgi:tungstate transport system ATP-binding protein
MHGGERKFRAPALEIILPDSTPLGYGCVMFSSHDVTLSMEKPHGSARNVMHGKVADIEPVPGGLEVAVDVGIVICALITSSSLKELAIAAGLPVWLSFKATSVRFISAEEVLP